MSSDPSSAAPGASEKEVTDNATGLPSPQSEADPDQAREGSHKPLDDGSRDAVNDPDVPIASVEAPDPDHESDARSDSKSTSGGSISGDSDSEISDMYDIFRPSESPAETVLGMMDRMDRKMKRMREPQPLRYAKEITHEKIDDHGTLLKFLCDRLAYLEHEVEILRTGRPAEEEASPSPSVIAAPVPKTRRVPITEYGNYQWFNRRNVPSPNIHVDFVLEVQLVRDDAGIQTWPPPGVGQNAPSGLDHRGNEQVVESAHGVMIGDLTPHRVRICSPLLLACIRDICKESFSANNHIVFIRPFKVFVRHEKDIREALDKAEAQFQGLFKDEQPHKSRKDPETKTGNSRRNSKVSHNETDMNDDLTEPDHSGTAHGRPERDSGTNSEESSDEGELDEASKEMIRERFEHLRLLVQFFDGPLKPVFDLYHSIKDGSATRIPFEYLWYLFEHGQEVVKQGGDLQLARVLRFTGGRETRIPSTLPPPPPPPPGAPRIPPSPDPPPTITNSFAVDCYRWEFDGEKFGVLNNVYWIRPYKGLKDITSLPVYPFSFHKNSSKVRNQLEDRGEKFLTLSRRNEASHRHYNGLTLESNVTSAEEIDSRVIIDQRSAVLAKPNWKPLEGSDARSTYDDNELFVLPHSPDDWMYTDHFQDQKAADKWFMERKHILEPSDDRLAPPDDDKILLSFFLYGFVLRSRKWAKLHIDRITDIEDKNSFDDLVIPEGHARSIKALVENHNRGPGKDKETDHVEVSMDLVRGKGKGVIILLHGEPGVGKTSTAECIADYTSRPLYPITCGDIGETADDVESNLEKTFQLAHKWGCVLLLDEADVFLQERNKEDLTRNAVVSVFLRVLEYYSGILFLTTNRVGIIDQAFRSRIHLSLYYPALDKDATLTIWKMHLKNAKDRFRDKGRVLEVDRKQILRFAKEQFKKMKKDTGSNWNGRQIRNAFQTAIALAEYHAQGKGHDKKTKLTVEEFKTVQETSDSFDKYLLATQKASQAALARASKIRSDDFKTQEPGVRDARRRPRAKGRHRRQAEIESGTDSTISSESSASSSEDNDESDSDAGEKQDEKGQNDAKTDGDSDSETEKKKVTKNKSKKPTTKDSKKKEETSSDEEESRKSKKKNRRHQENNQASEQEEKAKRGKGKKKATRVKEESETSSEQEVKTEKKRSKR